jgi:hypothetical protein
MLTDAVQVEIVRAHQKDDYYLASLRSRLTDLAQSIFGRVNINLVTSKSRIGNCLGGNEDEFPIPEKCSYQASPSRDVDY